MPVETKPGTTLAIGSVTLVVHDLEGMARFYRAAVGLAEIARATPDEIVLGAGGVALLTLRRDPAARRRTRREAGLFHTAFLLPRRADLAAWVAHAATGQAPVGGASDHLVSEALYLSDPEGNGIEIYADRPAAGWRWRGGEVGMDTLPLDFASLAAAVEGPWRGAPAGTTVGHVHLQVGNLRDAEAFYAGQLGLDITSRMPGALFYSADGYHHHLATNIWNSRAAGPRDLPSTGLAEVVLSVQAERLAGLGGAAVLEDPWRTPIRLSVGRAADSAFRDAAAHANPAASK